MGGVISRMEEVAPTARNTGKSPAMQTQSLKAIPPRHPPDMDPIMFFREADPRCAGWTVGARREYCFRLFRVRVPEVLRVIIEPRIVQNARDGPMTNRQRIVHAANRGGILHQFLVASAVRDYRAF